MKRALTKHLILITFCIFIGFLSGNAQVSVNDSLALVDFYDSTNGANWTVSTNWKTQNPINTWYGVGVLDGRIFFLSLAGDNLTGHIPESFGILTALSIVNLQQCKLTGTVPQSMSNLQSLTELDISSNQLSGPFPLPICALANLQDCYISTNKFSGPIPDSIEGLKNVLIMNLSNNKFTGPLPATFANLLKLTDLTLSYNAISGALPEPLRYMPSLTDIRLDNNKLSGTIPDWLGSTNFNRIELQSNSLVGPLPQSLANLSTLLLLNISNNKLGGAIPEWMGNFSNLQELYLQNDQFTGKIPATLGALPNIANLYLDNNQFDSDTIPSWIGVSPTLIRIGLSYDNFTGSLNTLALDTSLTSIDVSHNELSGTIPPGFLNFPDLRVFNISYNKFTFSGLENLVKKYSFLKYSPQAKIPVNMLNGALSISPGGTLSNNTFNWYNDSALVYTVTGDSLYHYTSAGSYSATVTNDVATKLTLYSDTTYFGVLPVTIISFTASPQNSSALLQWQTVSEVNNDYFSIERSSGNGFVSIGKISSKSYPAGLQTYNFKDNTPFSGVNYYRLKRFDKTGYFTYSKIEKLTFSDIKNIAVYPNPVADILHIENLRELSTIYITTQNGKTVGIVHDITGTYNWNVRALAAGTYFLNIKESSTTKTMKFAKE